MKKNYSFIYLFTCLLVKKLPGFDFEGLKLQVLEIILIANKGRTRKNKLHL